MKCRPNDLQCIVSSNILLTLENDMLTLGPRNAKSKSLGPSKALWAPQRPSEALSSGWVIDGRTDEN